MRHEFPSTLVGFLQILSDGKRHGGTEIAAALGVSRAAIWKLVQRLKHYDVVIESEHLGYHLKDPLFPLVKSKILEHVTADCVIDVVESLSSTNDYLKEIAAGDFPHICLTEHQTQGKGRLGRSWVSPFGRNIYCSVRYVFHADVSDMSGLSLVVGILVAQALEKVNSQFKPQLKWPNDIYLDGKKVGGILIDLFAEANGSCRAVIGIGMNVNMKDVAMKGVENWSSLEEMVGRNLDRNDVVIPIINSVLEGLKKFSQEGFQCFTEEWQRLDFLMDKKVSLQSNNGVVKGVAKGITPEGHLVVNLPQGPQSFSHGDVSLLKY